MYAFNTNLNLVSGGDNPYKDGTPYEQQPVYIYAGGGSNQPVHGTVGVNYHPTPDVRVGGSVTVNPGGSTGYNASVTYIIPFGF